ncbi:hypothetical protein GQ457_16G006520 [Hibiscus cannabinus]
MVKNNPVQGRRKIEMKKIASELCTLCGVDVAIIVFSPAGKVFSFGHPHVESIVDQFLTRNPSVRNFDARYNVIETHRDANIRELNAYLAQLVGMLEVEKRNGEALDEVREAGRRQWWWQAPIDELGSSELQQLRNALLELKRNVEKQVELMQAAVESSNCWPFLAPNDVGNSGFGCEENGINVPSSTAQMYKFDEDLYLDF